MKSLRLFVLLFPLLLTFSSPSLAQTQEVAPFSPTPIPVVTVTSTDALLFIMGFLDADGDIARQVEHVKFLHMFRTNRMTGDLLVVYGNRFSALYFYGRALRYELAAYEAGE